MPQSGVGSSTLRRDEAEHGVRGVLVGVARERHADPAARSRRRERCARTVPDVRTQPDFGERVGITERAAQRIVGELEAAEYLTRERDGRRNHYQVHLDRGLRHPIEAPTTIGDLCALMARKRRR